MNLSFRQLATFREVMRSGSISQAAKTVGRTQPAVSAVIAALEQELGFALFLREHARLTPTPEAYFFLEEAEAVLARLERAKQTLGRVGALQTGHLRIACHPAASSVFMPRLLTRFLQDRHAVNLSLIMRSSATIEDLIASQQFDIGFAEPPPARASIEQRRFDLECVCLLRADDPLAARPVITPHDLDGEPMAILFDEHTTATQTEAAFTASGCRFNKRIELRTFLPGLQFVAEGYCYVVCDMITAYSHVLTGPSASRLAVRRFRPRVSNEVSILTPAYVSQAQLAGAFVNHLASAIDTMRSDVEAWLNRPMDLSPQADPGAAGA